MLAKLLKWFFILLPFIYFDGVLDSSGTPRLLFLSLFLCVAFSLSLLKNIQIKVPKTFTLIYVLYLVSVAYSSAVNGAFIDFVEILKRLEYYLFFILVYSLDDEFSNKIIHKGYIAFLCIIVGFGLIQLLMISYNQGLVKEQFYAISTTFSHKNIYSTVLLLSVPFCVLWSGSKRLKFLLLGLVLILLVTIQTRSVLLALFISSLYYSLSRVDVFKNNFRSILFMGAVVLVLSVLCLHQLGTYDYFTSIFDLGNTSSLRSSTILERFYLWKHSFQMFLDHWLIGVGVGKWSIYFPFYGLTLWRLRQGEVIMQRPHNDLLENFNELGIVGGLLFLCLLIYPIIKRSGIRNKEVINFGLLSFLVVSIFSFPQERVIPSLLFFSLIAFKLKGGSSIQVKKYVLLFLSVGLFSLSYLVYGRLQSEIGFKHYITHQKSMNTDEAIGLLSEVKSSLFVVDGTSTPIDWYLGNLNLNINDVKQAKEHFNKALIISPYNIHILNSLGGCSIFENDFVQAKAYFERAVHIAPYYEDGLYNYSYALYRLRKFSDAIGVLKAVYDKDTARFEDRILFYAKSKIGYQLSNQELGVKEKEVLENLLYNEPWLKSIIFKSYNENRPFSSQLDSDINFITDSQFDILNN